MVKDRVIRSAEQELSEDLMAIVHVFSCRHHGVRVVSSKSSCTSLSFGKLGAAPHGATGATGVQGQQEVQVQEEAVVRLAHGFCQTGVLVPRLFIDNRVFENQPQQASTWPCCATSKR